LIENVNDAIAGGMELMMETPAESSDGKPNKRVVNNTSSGKIKYLMRVIEVNLIQNEREAFKMKFSLFKYEKKVIDIKANNNGSDRSST